MRELKRPDAARIAHRGVPVIRRLFKISGATLPTRRSLQDGVIPVYSVGPRPGQLGGMASVVEEMLSEHAATEMSNIHLTVVDSGAIGVSRVRRLKPLASCLLKLLLAPRGVVHIHVASRGSTWRKMLVSYICRLRRLPYGIHLHGASYGAFIKDLSPLSLRGVRNFFENAAYVVVLGSTWAHLIENELSVDRRKIHIVPNGVRPPERADAGDDATISPTVLFLGRIERLKGVHVLLEAWPLVPESARLLLAGSPDDSQLVDDLVALSADSSARVTYLGAISRQAAEQELRRATALVLPSLAEGLPMVIIEALARGVPVVATPVGAIGEVIQDGVNGVIVPTDDSQALARAITRLVLEPQYAARLGFAGVATWSAKLSSSVMYRQLQSIWTGVAAGWLLGVD